MTSSNFDPQRPHNALPLLPPVVDLETKAVLKKVVSARTAVAELKAMASHLPNQAVLLQTIGLVEAKMSSEIENIVTTNDVLYRALLDDGRTTDPATKEVLAYQRAMEEVRLKVQQQRPKLYSKDLVELLFRAPYTKVAFLEEARLARRVTATQYLRELVDLGLLEEHKLGRELYFLNIPFWLLLSGQRSDMFTP